MWSCSSCDNDSKRFPAPSINDIEYQVLGLTQRAESLLAGAMNPLSDHQNPALEDLGGTDEIDTVLGDIR
jgi:hypothetical protein